MKLHGNTPFGSKGRATMVRRVTEQHWAPCQGGFGQRDPPRPWHSRVGDHPRPQAGARRLAESNPWVPASIREART